MHNDRALVPAGGIADAATVPIALQDRFPKPSKILLILPLQRVAGRTQAKGEHLRLPAWAMHDPLTNTFHFPAPATYLYRV